MLRTYLDLYSDASLDPYQQSYSTISNEFAVPLQGASLYAPHTLAVRVAQASSQDIPIALVALCRDPTANGDLGSL